MPLYASRWQINVAELTYKEAEHGGTKVKYRYLKIVLSENILLQSITVFCPVPIL